MVQFGVQSASLTNKVRGAFLLAFMTYTLPLAVRPLRVNTANFCPSELQRTNSTTCPEATPLSPISCDTVSPMIITFIRPRRVKATFPCIGGIIY